MTASSAAFLAIYSSASPASSRLAHRLLRRELPKMPGYKASSLVADASNCFPVSSLHFFSSPLTSSCFSHFSEIPKTPPIRHRAGVRREQCVSRLCLVLRRTTTLYRILFLLASSTSYASISRAIIFTAFRGYPND